MNKRSKTPIRYHGYYCINERYGSHEPEFMAIMEPHDNGDGGFSAEIYAKPVSFTLEFFPDDGDAEGRKKRTVKRK